MIRWELDLQPIEPVIKNCCGQTQISKHAEDRLFLVSDANFQNEMFINIEMR